MRRHLDPDARYGLRVTLFAVALTLVAVPFGLLLDQVVRDGPLTEADTWAANHLHGLVRHSDGAVRALKVLTFFGTPPWFYLLCGTAVVFLWHRHRRRLACYIVATTLGGGLVDTIVKLAVNRDRPSLTDPIATAHGKSFPSGHSMTATVAYGALFLVFLPAIPPRRRTPVLVAVVTLVLAIGFSRLALGVHYVTDVLGGFVLGLAWLAAATAAFEIWRVERGRRPTAPLHEGVEPEAPAELVP